MPQVQYLDIPTWGEALGKFGSSFIDEYMTESKAKKERDDIAEIVNQLPPDASEEDVIKAVFGSGKISPDRAKSVTDVIGGAKKRAAEADIERQKIAATATAKKAESELKQREVASKEDYQTKRLEIERDKITKRAEEEGRKLTSLEKRKKDELDNKIQLQNMRKEIEDAKLKRQREKQDQEDRQELEVLRQKQALQREQMTATQETRLAELENRLKLKEMVGGDTLANIQSREQIEAENRELKQKLADQQAELKKTEMASKEKIAGENRELKREEIEAKKDKLNKDYKKKLNEKIIPIETALNTVSELEKLNEGGYLGVGSGVKANIYGGRYASDTEKYKVLAKSLISRVSDIPVRNREEFREFAEALTDPTLRDAKRKGILEGLRKNLEKSKQLWASDLYDTQEKNKGRPPLEDLL